MSRKAARELALHMIFEMDFTHEECTKLIEGRMNTDSFESLKSEDVLYESMPAEEQMAYINDLVSGVQEKMEELDSYIEKYSVGWKVGRISKIAISVMRLSMYEILYMPDVPDGASINEAVEFVKRYDSKESASFVNGILGTFVRTEKSE